MMASTEIEIKLSPVLPHQAAALWADAELAPHLGASRQIRMHSRYFDTPSGDLAARREVLRLRWQDGVGVCAFKGPVGPSGARLELETPAETLEGGVRALLARPELAQDARTLLETGSFSQIAAARFVRQSAVWQRGELAFEVCHDQGQFERGARTGALGEIEFELICGDRGDMAALAERVRARHGLPIGTLSKLGQALALGRDAGRAVNPFFVSSELLNYCVRMGWLELELDAQKMLHYRLTETGTHALPERFGVDFGKPCAFAGQEDAQA